MDVWRLARRLHRALDGEGARVAAGRWNSPGRPMVYTSGSLSLVAMEYLVHVAPDTLPADLTAFQIVVPGTLAIADVPWGRDPPPGWTQDLLRTRRTGDEWLVGAQQAVLRVPSAVIPGEWNYLINPRHPDAARIRVAGAQAFRYDPRVWQRGT